MRSETLVSFALGPNCLFADNWSAFLSVNLHFLLSLLQIFRLLFCFQFCLSLIFGFDNGTQLVLSLKLTKPSQQLVCHLLVLSSFLETSVLCCFFVIYFIWFLKNRPPAKKKKRIKNKNPADYQLNWSSFNKITCSLNLKLRIYKSKILWLEKNTLFFSLRGWWVCLWKFLMHFLSNIFNVIIYHFKNTFSISFLLFTFGSFIWNTSNVLLNLSLWDAFNLSSF